LEVILSILASQFVEEIEEAEVIEEISFILIQTEKVVQQISLIFLT
jgi:hypothetical protein